MGLPFGFKYLRNMALYETNDRAKLIKHYGKDLESHFDLTDKLTYKNRIFCLDCLDLKECKGRFWKKCPYRAEIMRIMKEGS